jgi:ubiquinone/menaquinone biosynthesis C-methylase UbiE
MEINYQETSKDLLKRIDIHEKYGARNIDQWNLEVLQPQRTHRILDVGCGAGKQCFLFSNYTKGEAEIVGGDFSEELLDKARAIQSRRAGERLSFQFLDFNKKFPFEDNSFDLVTSAFAIYYASDLEFTFGEAHRVLRSPQPEKSKPGGRLFVTGPLPENKQMFYDIIQEASNKPIPPMPGSSRFKGEIFQTIDSIFAKTELLTFENPLTFPEVAPFIEYVRASLSEDRKLWTSMFSNKQEYENLIQNIEAVANRWFERDGILVMTKVVGGILATK